MNAPLTRAEAREWLDDLDQRLDAEQRIGAQEPLLWALVRIVRALVNDEFDAGDAA